MKITDIIKASLVLSLFMIPNFAGMICLATESSTSISYEQITSKYPSMAAYVAQARKMVKDNWYPPVNAFENSATIILTLNKDGKLLNCFISIPSGNDDFDTSLLDAAKKATYSPLPNDVNEDVVNIDLSFNMQKRHLNLKKKTLSEIK